MKLLKNIKMSNKKTILLLFLLCSNLFFSQQEKDIAEINEAIAKINYKVLRINAFNAELQNYQRQITTYFTEFDSTKITFKKEPRYSFTAANNINSKNSLYRTLKSIEKEEKTIDSLSGKLNIKNDFTYSPNEISKFNGIISKINIAKAGIKLEIRNLEKTLKIISQRYKAKIKINSQKKLQQFVQKRDSIQRGIWVYKEKDTLIFEKVEFLPDDFERKLQDLYKFLGKCTTKEDSLAFINKYLKKKNITLEVWRNAKKGYWEYIVFNEYFNYNQEIDSGILYEYNQQNNEELNQLYNLQLIDVQLLKFDPERLKQYELRRTDVYLILILDISNSMNVENRIGQLKESVIRLIETMKPYDKLAIILFSTRSKVLISPEDINRSKNIELVKSIQAFGDTYPENAIFRAYNIMITNAVKKKNNRVILVTDGSFDESGSMKSLIRKGLEKDITFSMIRIEGEEIKDNELRKLHSLTEIGQGNYYSIDSASETYNTIIEEIEKLRK